MKRQSTSWLRFDSPRQEAYLSLWRTYDRLQALEEECFKSFGLTAQQYNVLRLLQAAYPESVPTWSLARRLISRAPDLTRMMDRLEVPGWIVRTRSEKDRRAVLVAITPSGLATIEALQGPLTALHEKQLGHLTEAELTNLTELLARVRQPHEVAESPWARMPERMLDSATEG